VYLVGDFIDAWKCNRGWHWSAECDEIVAHLEGLIRGGTEIFYVPGNHDSFLRNASFLRLVPQVFSQIKIADEFVFETRGGWRFLVTHGDLFDWFETQAQWISKATAGIYDAILSLNRLWNRHLGRHDANPYGACAVIKDRVKRGVRFISKFEATIMQHAHRRQCEGVICGHIHTPDIIHRGGLLYCNTGDWVENCTGLVEHHDGTIRLESTYSASKTLVLETHSRRREEGDVAKRFPSDMAEPKRSFDRPAAINNVQVAKQIAG